MKTKSSFTAGKAAVMAGMLGIYFFWGTSYTANQIAVRAIPPFLLTGVRSLFAGLVLYGIRRAMGDVRPSLKAVWPSFLVGALMIGFGSGFVVSSQTRVPSGIAALVVGSVPLWVALLDFLGGGRTRHHRPGFLAGLGLFLGFGGIIVLIGPAKLFGFRQQVDPIGAAFLIFGAFAWALGSTRSRSVVFPSSPLLGTGVQMIGGGLTLLIMGLFSGQFSRFHPASLSLIDTLCFFYLVVFGSLVGFSLYTWLLKSAPTTLVTTYAYVNPLVAIFFGYLILGEPVSLRIIVSASIILGSVVLVSLGKRNASAPQRLSERI
jgi:drug/metabolite transporter (DMT)-like permease